MKAAANTKIAGTPDGILPEGAVTIPVQRTVTPIDPLVSTAVHIAMFEYVNFHAIGGVVIGIADKRRLQPERRPVAGSIGKLDAGFVITVAVCNLVGRVNEAGEIGAPFRVGADHQAA